VEVEKGKPRAAIGVLLRTVDALGLLLDADKPGPGKPKDTGTSQSVDTHVDIDPIVNSARRKRK